VAESIGIHPVHLAREFRKHYHCTVGEYLRRLRIEHASRKLIESDSSLVDISEAAGFADQSHFGRTFKRLMGITPNGYRALFSSAKHIPNGSDDSRR
jgi:AraC-like DNA-binding protein